MSEEETRKAAYAKWEAEGRPEGQHERHWREAENEARAKAGELPQTWSSDHGGGVSPPSGGEGQGGSTSDAIPSGGNDPDSFKPGELASENK